MALWATVYGMYFSNDGSDESIAGSFTPSVLGSPTSVPGSEYYDQSHFCR